MANEDIVAKMPGVGMTKRDNNRYREAGTSSGRVTKLPPSRSVLGALHLCFTSGGSLHAALRPPRWVRDDDSVPLEGIKRRTLALMSNIKHKN